jgi:hypothetical protein
MIWLKIAYRVEKTPNVFSTEICDELFALSRLKDETSAKQNMYIYEHNDVPETIESSTPTNFRVTNCDVLDGEMNNGDEKGRKMRIRASSVCVCVCLLVGLYATSETMMMVDFSHCGTSPNRNGSICHWLSSSFAAKLFIYR